MKIRLLTQEDHKIWKEFRLKALQSSPESFGSSYEEEVNRLKEDWQNGLIKSDIFGAFIDEGLIAVAGFFIYDTLKKSHRGMLFGMYTIPEHRGQGIASQLIETVIIYARSKVIQLHLACITNNESAIKLYQKHGFKIYGTEPRALKMSNNFFDDHLMILELDK